MASIKRIYPSIAGGKPPGILSLPLTIIIFGILSILLIAFIVWPLYKEIKQISQSFSLERNKIVYLNEEKENIKKIENIYKIYQPDLNKIETLFFDPEVPIGFIGFLEKTANDSQVKLEISSMVKNAEKDESWPNLSLQILTTGSFSNSSKFFEKIENGPYLIEIIDLSARKLTKEQTPTKELEGIPEIDTTTILSIRVFTK